MSSSCTCTDEGYSPECPQAFVQGGTILHTIEAETKLKPRMYRSINAPTDGPQDVYKYICDKGEQERVMNGGDNHTPSNSDEGSNDDPLSEAENGLVRALNTNLPVASQNPISNYRTESQHRPTMYRDADDLIQGNRAALPRFKPLTIRGQQLTNYEIGGFNLDLGLVAAKYREIMPLPPSKLPIIFSDDELNFYHHFFQGLATLIGSALLKGITDAHSYKEDAPMLIIPVIAGKIIEGYRPDDTELTVFVKKVLSSTFDLASQSISAVNITSLHVSSNIWGFQYLEQGMTCKDHDLCMWLNQCYLRYRTVWFNTFKSSGVPTFASGGAKPDTSGSSGEHSNSMVNNIDRSRRHRDVGFDTARHRNDDKPRERRYYENPDRSRRPGVQKAPDQGGIRDWIRRQSTH